MTTFAERIKKRRKELGLTQKQLGKMTGVSSTSIVYWERGENTPSGKYLRNLCKALNVDIGWLAYGEKNTEPASDDYLRSDQIPLISWVAAGGWNEAVDPFQAGDADDWYLCPAKHSASSYALTVKGDSMTSPVGRSYPEGMIIFVDPEKQANNGDRVIAKIKGDDAVTFKQLVIDSGKHYLKPLNLAYPIIADPFIVIGKVIGAYMEE